MSAVDVSYGTPYGIICDAMIDAGKLRRGSEPSSEELAANMRALNKLINYLQTQGCKLWLLNDYAMTLVPPLSTNVGVALYTLGPFGTVVMPKPLRVISAYYLYTSGDQYPLICLSYPDEYNRLSQVLQPGSVNSYAVNKQSAYLGVYLWNPPDAYTVANGTVHLLLEQSVTNFVGITDQTVFPIEWSLTLEYCLADLLSTGQPASVQQRNAQMAMKYQTALENWDVEDASTFYQPDQRMQQWSGKFR